MSQTAITINRSPSGSGLDVLRRFLARFGIRVKIDRYAVALVAISLLVLAPMFQPGYFWGAHDGRHAVYFLFEFDRVFTDGVLYPRWFPDMTYGLGYPLFNIYGPLAFYLGEVIHLIGIDFVTATKIVFGLTWVLSGLAMYGFVKRLFENRPAAFIAGLLFVFMPYHIIDIYVRAALAESVALLFMPLTLWAFYETVMTRSLRSALFAAFAYAGMVFAHDGIALLFSIVLGAWILFLFFRENSIRGFLSRQGFWGLVRASFATVGGLALGLGMTAIFLFPLVLEYKYINVAQWTANYYNYQDHFVEVYQLFSPFWGFGISNKGPVDGLSFQLGLIPVILALFSLFVVARNPNQKRAYVLFFLILTGVVMLLMFEFSLPAWQAFGLAGIAQFPWRLLTLTTASLSIVGGSIMLLANGQLSNPSPAESPDNQQSAIQNQQSPDSQPAPIENQNSKIENSSSAILSVVALSALIVFASYSYITDQNILEPKEGPVGLAGLMAFENSANEMTGSTSFANEQPLWSPLADIWRLGKTVKSKIDFSTVPAWLFIRIPRDSLHVDGEKVDYNAPNGDVNIVYNVQMYPGWHVYLTDARSNNIVRELPIQINQPYGRIQVTLPQGEHGLWLRFQDTPPRTLGTIVSGISLLIALGLFIWDARLRRKQAQSNGMEPAPTVP